MGYTVHLLSFPSTVFGYQLQHMIYKGGPLPKYIIEITSAGFIVLASFLLAGSLDW